MLGLLLVDVLCHSLQVAGSVLEAVFDLLLVVALSHSPHEVEAVLVFTAGVLLVLEAVFHSSQLTLGVGYQIGRPYDTLTSSLQPGSTTRLGVAHADQAPSLVLTLAVLVTVLETITVLLSVAVEVAVAGSLHADQV